MGKILFLSLLVVVGLQAGCARPSSMTATGSTQLAEGDGNQGQDSEGGSDDVVGEPSKPYIAEPLSWESSRSEGKDWSEYAFKVIREEAFSDLDKAIDVEIFCPNYDNMSTDQRVNFWGGLISGMARYESGYSPTSRYLEGTLGTDPVTGKAVYSEGLLQLSYQDTQWATYCEFDWSKDKNLSATDPNKTILNPYKNLRCGIKILAAQVKRTREIVLSSGVYWSVLKDGGRYEKIDEIAAITKKLTFCNR